MMATIRANDYEYCSICKTNHTKGPQHVYTTRHKELIQKMLKKFSERISVALKLLEEPSVTYVSPGEKLKFWCYFCQLDLVEHQQIDGMSLQCAEMLKHLASSNHWSKTNAFWYRNRLDRSLLDSYFVDQDTFGTYLSKLSKVKMRFAEEMKKKLAQDAKVINDIEVNRQLLVETEVYHLKGVSNQPTASHQSDIGISSNSAKPVIPPWLQDDAGDSAVIEPTGPIGPTKEDFDKNNERKKKRQLPPNRTGANFERSASFNPDWLVNFGRVWNHGRRLQSKHEFNRKFKRSRK